MWKLASDDIIAILVAFDQCLQWTELAVAATRKLAKYSTLGTQYDLQPVAVETLGPLNESACEFLNNLGRKIGDNTGDNRSTSFLFQWISVSV